MIDVSVEQREVTVTKTFVEIDGHEFEFDEVFEFLNEVEGTDGFMTAVHVNGSTDLPDVLEELGYVAHSQARGWYERDSEACERLRETIEEEFTETVID